MVMETKMEYLSSNIVNIMDELSRDIVLSKLLLHNVAEPFTLELLGEDKNWDMNRMKIITPNDEYCKISPTPFNPDAQEKKESFIRVYYNQGSFDSAEIILEPQLFIDIIVSKDLWLINNKGLSESIDCASLIRPYEIMGRVVSRVGRDSMNGKLKLKFSGFQHLAVNTEFDALRLYSDSFSIEG